MAAPTITVEVAFSTANPLTVPGSWTDVSAYVRRISTRRGRNHELGRMGAGEATVTFDNGDRRFDPTNTAGAYYPNVVPMKRLRIRATHNAVTYDLFQGYVEDWGQEWLGRPINAQGDAEAIVRAVDAFKFLNLIEVPTYPAEVVNDEPFSYYLMDGAETTVQTNYGTAEDADCPMYELGLTYGVAGPLDGGCPGISLNGYAAGSPTGTGFPLAYRKHFARSWTVEAWVYPIGNTIYVANIGSAAMGYAYVWITTARKVMVSIGNPVVQVTGTNVMSNATWHHLAAVKVGTTVDVYVDGAFSETLTGFPLFTDDDFSLESQFVSHVFTDGGLTHVAAYDYALPAARIGVHASRSLGWVNVGQTTDAAITAVLDAIGWAGGDRSLTASTHTVSRFLPSGDALGVLLDLAENTDAGTMFIRGDGDLRFISSNTIGAAPASLATWGDAGGETNYSDLSFRYDDADLFTNIRATAAGLPASLAIDDTATTAYGPRNLDTDAGVLETLNQVDDRASGFLTRYKSPAIRPETLKAMGTGSDTARLAEMLTTDVGRRVTVVRRPPGGGSAISIPCYVEGVAHDVSGVLTQWVTTLNLAPVLDATPWILADSTYGVLGTTTDLGF